jgi:hypothetical protein
MVHSFNISLAMSTMWLLSHTNGQRFDLTRICLGFRVVPTIRMFLPLLYRVPLFGRLFHSQTASKKSASDIPCFPADPAEAMPTQHTVDLVATIISVNQNATVRAWVCIGQLPLHCPGIQVGSFFSLGLHQ